MLLLCLPPTIRNINKPLLVVVLLIFTTCSIIFFNVARKSQNTIQEQLSQISLGVSKVSLCNKLRQSSCGIDSSPRKSIFYIKIHKTGSTTLRSTLLNYGRTYNLTICMDATDMWGLNWPYHIDNLHLTKLHGEKCGIIAEELVYDRNTVRQLMSKDVFVMASVRHPVQHFLSLYKYTHIHAIMEKLLERKLEKYLAMRMFLQNYTLIQNTVAALPESEMRDKLQINLIRSNLQVYSLGVREYNVEEIKTMAAEIDFFVVTEQFNESMVILRDKLCCRIEDVVYRKQNRRRSSAEKKEAVPEDILRSILDFNKGDLLLYKIALGRLNCDIHGHSDINQSLGILKYELEKYDTKCRNIEEGKRYEVCPPIHNGQVGIFVENVRKEQRKKLMRKLRKKALKLVNI